MTHSIALLGFTIAAICAGIRLYRGPTLADRVIALDVALVSLMAGIAIQAASSGSAGLITLLVVIAIVGFTATVAATRFIENEGHPE